MSDSNRSNQAQDEGTAPAPAGTLPLSGGKPIKVFSVGTLRYTTAGLVILFVWLLWGDFVFVLLDLDLPHIFPLKLHEMGADNTTVTLLLRSIPSTMVFLLSPVISFRSDRCRSRWGRRIPYLLWSAPLVGGFMILVGCHEELTAAFVGHSQAMVLLGHELSRVTVALVIFGVLLTGFSFVNVYVNTIYWYLFNDVVPKELMTRFMSVFRIVLALASMLYNKFMLAHALEYFREMFVIGGIAYIVGFMMMCLCVKEGKYPPPPPLALDTGTWAGIWRAVLDTLSKRWRQFLSASLLRQIAIAPLAVLLFCVLLGIALPLGALGLLGAGVEHVTLRPMRWILRCLRSEQVEARTPYVSGVSKRFLTFTNSAITYAKTCFTHRFYWFYFLNTAFATVSWQSSGPFRLMRDNKSLGLGLQEIGDVAFWAGWVSLAITYPMGWLADKFNPVRVYMASSFAVLIALGAQSVWAFYDFGHDGNLKYYYFLSIAMLPIYGINSLTQNPVAMRLLPKEQFGQFNSANSMLSALAAIFGSAMAGIFMDILQYKFNMGLWAFRCYPMWTIAFQLPHLFFLLLVYRYWKAHGGDRGFIPPET